jgi:acyl phosphate:glycerol-3-phosphate acyltransferase
MFPLLIATAAVVGYLLGSIPCGYLVARWHGVDIFTVGSRSPGATNVKRSVSKGAGNLVFALDFLKGLIAAAWVRVLPEPTANSVVWLGLTGMAAAVLGHCFSVFIKFRGGKGVATSLGGAIALMPWAALAGIAVWLALFLTTRYVSVASIGLAATLPVVAYFQPGNVIVFVFALGVAVFVIVLHRANIGRLLLGTEHRFARKSGEKPADQGPTP